MPVSIADLSRDRRTFEFNTDFGPVKIQYRPYAMTPAREADIARIGANAANDELDEDVSKTEQGLTKIVYQFCEVVEAWDLVGPLTDRTTGKIIIPEGERIEIKPENVRHVASAFLIQVLTAIAKDSRPKAMPRND